MFHVGFLSQEYEVDEWIHGISLATGGISALKGGLMVFGNG